MICSQWYSSILPVR